MHGHQIRRRGDVDELTKAAVKLGVDVLVSGHTHEPAIMRGGRQFTESRLPHGGAWSGGVVPGLLPVSWCSRLGGARPLRSVSFS